MVKNFEVIKIKKIQKLIFFLIKKRKGCPLVGIFDYPDIKS